MLNVLKREVIVRAGRRGIVSYTDTNPIHCHVHGFKNLTDNNLKRIAAILGMANREIVHHTQTDFNKLVNES